MNAHRDNFVAPMAYQAEVALRHAIAANFAEFGRRRAALVDEFEANADAIRAEHDTLSPAEFVAKYGARR